MREEDAPDRDEDVSEDDAAGDEHEGGAPVPIRICNGNAEASMLRALLESNGIRCIIQGENHRSMLGVMGGFIELRLMVPAGQVELAERILAEGQQTTGGAPEAPPRALGHGYRDPYPPVPADGPRPAEWRARHTWLAAVGILLVFALALAVALGAR